jgi:hypothetical protein
MVRQVIECESGNVVTIRAINPRLLVITPLDKSAELYGDKEIVGLDYSGEVGITCEEVFTVKRHKFKPQQIKRVDVKDNLQYGAGYYIYTTVLNSSFRFIMPLLGGKKDDYYFHSYFMNCFIGTEFSTGAGGHIYLWYRYIPTIEMEALEEKLFSHPNYVAHRDVDKHHVLYKFEVPAHYKQDVSYIMEGKYSKLHIDTKTRLLEFHGQSAEDVLGQILFQAVDRRKKLEADLGVELDPDAELYDAFDMSNEVFKHSYIIENNAVFNHENLKNESKV